jgi:hypothetical protein
MTDTTEQRIAQILSFGLVLVSFGMEHDEIVQRVRDLEAGGSDADYISSYLSHLVAEKKAAAHAVQPPA